ncbi:MAG: RNA-binding protein [Bacteroidales bacterium]|nr:RNA-binding protein [Bacteroidales bacterium]MBO7322945.1 RNA-binding protein [Bacteroidales bacterium]
MNIFISSLSYKARREDLINLFTPYGEVTAARIITDPKTRLSRGYGFVEMSEEDGMKAIEALNGSKHMGRTIWVAPGKERKASSTDESETKTETEAAQE